MEKVTRGFVYFSLCSHGFCRVQPTYSTITTSFLECSETQKYFLSGLIESKSNPE